MKPNKTLISTLVFATSMYLLSGCTSDEKKLWFKHEQAQKESQKLRTPAQAKPQCFYDRVSDSMVQEDLQKMEAAYANGRHASYQHGENSFNDLPQATIDVLKSDYALEPNAGEFKSWITSNASQKSCKDLSCIINALYANPKNEGTFHYWYFLKTGYAVSAYAGFAFNRDMRRAAGYSLESYLFDKKEWKALWLQASMLPQSMRFLPDLQSIHRLPRGFIPDEWKASGTAAWATGYGPEGDIVLSDEGLTLDNDTNLFDTNQYLYQAVTHEIAHRLSAWNFSKNNDAANKADQEPAFMAISGWTTERLTQPDGSVKLRWKSNDSAKNIWQSAYAQSSPGEDFAEMIGLYRTTPQKMKLSAPAKYDYAKKLVFAGRGYTTDDLRVQYAADLKAALIEQVSDWINPCISGQDGATLTAKQAAQAKLVQVNLPIDSKVKSCIQKQVVSTMYEQENQIRYNEPEGCLIMENFDEAIVTSAIAASLSDLNEYLKTFNKITDLMTGVQGFRGAIAQEFDGRALVLSCWKEHDAQACYDAKLAAEYDRLYLKFKVLLSASQADLSDIERKRFLAANVYDKMYADVVQFYDGLFSKFSDEINDRSGKLWEACLAVPPRANTDVLMTPYSPGSFYIAPAIIQCLNEKIPDEMATIRSEAGADQGVNILSNDAREWITQRILLPRFKANLDAKLKEAAKVEEAQLNILKQPTVDSTFDQMTHDLSWRKNGAYSYVECKAGAKPILQDKLKSDSYRFLPIDTTIDDLGNQVCEKVRAWVTASANAAAAAQGNVPVVATSGTANGNSPSPSTEPQTPVVPTASQKKQLDAIWPSFQPLMIAEASTRFEHCRQKVYFGQRLKRFCLFTEWVVDDVDQYRKTAWSWTKDRAIRKWMVGTDVKNFVNAQKYTPSQVIEMAKARAEDERQELGDAIADRFFKN